MSSAVPSGWSIQRGQALVASVESGVHRRCVWVLAPRSSCGGPDGRPRSLSRPGGGRGSVSLPAAVGGWSRQNRGCLPGPCSPQRRGEQDPAVTSVWGKAGAGVFYYYSWSRALVGRVSWMLRDVGGCGGGRLDGAATPRARAGKRGGFRVPPRARRGAGRGAGRCGGGVEDGSQARRQMEAISSHVGPG